MRVCPSYKQGIACTIYLIFLMKFVSLKYSKAMTQMKLPINDLNQDGVHFHLSPRQVIFIFRILFPKMGRR